MWGKEGGRGECMEEEEEGKGEREKGWRLDVHECMVSEMP